MKKILFFFTLIFIFFLNNLQAQEAVRGGAIKIKLKTIPELVIEEIIFSDENNNDIIDGGEQCYFDLSVKNIGRNPAEKPIVETTLINAENTDISFERIMNSNQINPGQSTIITIPVLGGINLKSGFSTFQFIVSDDGKYKSVSKQITKNQSESSNKVYLTTEWFYPVDFKTIVNKSKLKIRLCIKTKLPVTEASIYLNKKNHQSIKKFGPVSDDLCSYIIKKELYLERGLNEIIVKVKNQGRIIISEKRIIIYEPELIENRNALVIGNSKYKSSPLKNPVNDAKSMADALRELNFEVLEIIDADKLVMRNSVREFKERMKKDKGVGLFYYAGHGVQVKGDNYLIPINHDIQEEYDIQDEAIRINTIISYMQDAGTRMNIVILDACRNNPFESSMRSGSRGLATIHAEGSGTIIAYATSPGSTASDGDKKNGLYTQELLKAIQTEGLEIGMVFRRVLANVQRLSEGSQIPWVNSSIIGEFYFDK